MVGPGQRHHLIDQRIDVRQWRMTQAHEPLEDLGRQCVLGRLPVRAPEGRGQFGDDGVHDVDREIGQGLLLGGADRVFCRHGIDQ